jgi:type IV pilus assembly protein PilF
MRSAIPPRLLGVCALLLSVAACTTTRTTSATAPTAGNWTEAPLEAAKYNVELGVAYLRQGNLADARTKLERALKEDPQNPAAHAAAALLYEQLGEESKADQHYATALRLKPGDPDILNNYGVFLCRHDRAPQGEGLLLQATRDPLYQTPEVAFNNAGVCMRGVNRSAEAEKYFLQALAFRPRFSDPMLQLADMHFRSARYADAHIYVLRYLETAPASPEVLWLGVRVERALGNVAAAEAYAKRLKTEYPATDQTRALLESERKAG